MCRTKGRTVVALWAALALTGASPASATVVHRDRQGNQEVKKQVQPPVEPKPIRSTKTKSAAKQAKSAKAATARGEIVKSDATSVTFKTKAGEESFTISNDTKITQSGKAITTADLAPGDKATVSYTIHGDQMTATRITVAARKDSKAAKPPKQPKAPK